VVSSGPEVSLGSVVSLGAGDVAGWQGLLAGVRVDVGDRQRVELIGALERLKSAAAAAQVRLVAAMAAERVQGAPNAASQAE
jgi:hypothetical protein